MTIDGIIKARQIEELLHFTTNQGITGILATGDIKARNYLPQEEHLEFIYKYNCEDRSRDRNWWDYVNLSITSVNSHLFNISSNRWHSQGDNWWCILALDPQICTHEDVYFTTTNNMYSGVTRNKGTIGLEALFDTRIERWNTNIINREKTTPRNQPTCEQAEVLYPNSVLLDYATKIYVENDENLDKIESIKTCFPNSTWLISCEVKRQLFGKEPL